MGTEESATSTIRGSRDIRGRRSGSTAIRALALSVLAATLLSLAACGGDDRAPGLQGEAADHTIRLLEAEIPGVDRGCVHDAARDLSDADARALVNDGELSAEGDEIAFRMFVNCVDLE